MVETKSAVVELHLSPEKLAEVDEIARWTERDRKGVLEKALDAYLELHRWQANHIQDGLRQANAGEFASDEEVARAFRTHRAV